MRESYWLITTQKLEDKLWFRDEDDFKAGMNFVAILASTSSICIMAFVLMSNHVHFVVECSREEAFAFIVKYKKTYSQYFASKYSDKGLLHHNGLNFKELTIGDESFERAVAYVQMNPVAANICLNPAGYPWGSGDSFFRAAPPKGKRIGELSLRARAKIIHSRTLLPTHYLVDENGVVFPSSYINIRFVESVFRSPGRMNYFLNNSSKAKLLKETPSFNDQIILPAIKSLCISLFRKRNLFELTDIQQAEILRQIRYRFSADPNQIARVTGIPYKTVSQLMELI